MAMITDMDGNPISQGLQGCDTCDEALQIAIRQAAERDEAVCLSDDDGEWTVHPDGSVDAA